MIEEVKGMDDRWAKLSPGQRRAERLTWYATPVVPFASQEAEKAYLTRVQRFVDVYKVEEPDRVPVSLPAGTLPAYMYGADYRAVMYDYKKAAELWLRFNEDFQCDHLVSPARLLPGPVYERLDYRLYAWPGHAMPDTAKGYQYVEGEYMKAGEYDYLIRDFSGFLMGTFMPRAFGALEPFAKLSPLINVLELPTYYFMPHTKPEVQAALQALIDAGRLLAEWNAFMKEFDRRGKSLGFPPQSTMCFCKAPFDYLGDTLRGTKGIMTDMYRRPDKVLEAMDVVADASIANVVDTLNATRGLTALFPLHKGADGWMSEKQFDTFYWPPLKKVIDACVDEGILVTLFAEGAFNTRLDRVNEFPKGAVHWIFDRTDMATAKRVLGGNCCISGNVPSSILAAGTPGEVKEYCRKLIGICAPGGGYILTPGTADLTEARPENVRAMMEAAREYGVYGK